MKIRSVEKESLAEKHHLSSQDEIFEINNKPIKDIIDYRFYCAEEKLELLVKDKNERMKKIKIKKKLDEDLGIILKEDRYRRCPNKCVFCFVDQLPQGLRKPLYFKDEDYRLSFLHGNFITLTNLSNEDVQRIVKQRISPLYVSVHTTDENLRKKMLSNERIPDIMPLIKKLTRKRIELHTQIVLCPGINDRDYLKQTVFDLASFYPYVRSVGVVPVGLTRFRENLPQIKSVSKEYAKEIIKKVKGWQKSFGQKHDESFVYLADEFFLKAGLDIPSAKYYDDFYQIENGVGLVRKFLDGFKKEQKLLPKKLKRKTKITLVTGKLSAKFIRKITEEKINETRNLLVKIVEVRNDFFGEMVSVSGLLAGEDIMQALRDEGKLGEMILLPPNCVNSNDRFLDDLTPQDLEREFRRKVIIGSYSFAQTMIDLLKSAESL